MWMWVCSHCAVSFLLFVNVFIYFTLVLPLQLYWRLFNIMLGLEVLSEWTRTKTKLSVFQWRPDTMSNKDKSFTQWTPTRLLNDEHSPKYSEEFHELGRDKRHPSHPTVLYVSLSVLTQLGQQTAGWMRRVLRVRRGELSYIPSIEAVRLPTRSLPVQSREIGREEFPLCVHTGHGHNHTEACVHPGHKCACVCVCVCVCVCACMCVCDVWNWEPSVIWLACYFLTGTL